MAHPGKAGWRYADDRRLVDLARSSNSLEAVATEMNRDPKTIAKWAKRLGLSLKPLGKLNAKIK